MRRCRGLVVALVLGIIAASGACTPPAIIYSYEVRGWDNTSNLEQFATLAAFTLVDNRGWNLGGAIEFRRVPSGGNFTLWLSAPVHVASFSSVCSSSWSCSVGRNVIINERNWLNATAAWNGAGASRRDYQNMVINHETGHWLGFGHAFCAGTGASAPVMQQQSISLQGCRASAWPSASERRTLAGWKRVAIR